MRFNKQKLLSGVLATGLALSCMVGPAFAAGTSPKDAIKDAQTQAETGLVFSDVKQGDWYYDAVMDMTKMGLFSGTGNGQFSPDKTMTRGEFLTVVVRYLYNNELQAMGALPADAHWADNARLVALDKDIINNNEMPEGSMSKEITRQEMAMLLVRASDANGERKPQQIHKSKIEDFDTIGTYYSNYVVDAISRGLIAGTASNEENHSLTFTPRGVLTRGQAATVLYRLITPENRGTVDYTMPVYSTEIRDPQTWVEGEKHEKPKAGDTVIKADGTKVVLKVSNGILGFGQGVDIITGTTINGVSAREGLASWYDQTPFIKCNITGEMYSRMQWLEIRRISWPTGLVGEYDGEIYNTYFKWSEQEQYWNWIGPNY